MMKPKSQGPHDEGLLEYLEDIIGSNKYVEAIEAGSKTCARFAHTGHSCLHRLTRHAVWRS